MCELSIIIPFYKSEKYIRECLDSILGQWNKNPEIICVNDNSPDNTAEIICEYSKKYAFIRLINVEGNGVSAARNTGLRHATGKYVCFVDSDDKVFFKTFSKTFLACMENDADVYVFGGVTTVPSNEKIWMKACLNPVDSGMCRFKPEVLLRRRGSLPVTWNKFFKRSMLIENNIVFPEKLSVAEDLVFQFEAMTAADKIFFSGEKAYCYRIMVEESAMTYFDKEKMNRAAQHIEAVTQIFRIWREKQLDETALKAWAVDFLYSTMAELEEENRPCVAGKIIKFFEENNITAKDQRPNIHFFKIIEAYGVLGLEEGNTVYCKYRQPLGVIGKIRRKIDFLRRNSYMYGLNFALKICR